MHLSPCRDERSANSERSGAFLAPLPDPKLSETLAMRMRRALTVRVASHAGKLIEGQLLDVLSIKLTTI